MAADKLISSGSPYEPILGYSRATVAGEYVHVSGSTATVGGVLQHQGDAYGQAKVAIETVIANALAEVGYSLKMLFAVGFTAPRQKPQTKLEKRTVRPLVRFVQH
jgi:enamine deaminase RidA (YjgF/YER057c/UK114 family)